KKEFSAFFRFIGFTGVDTSRERLIHGKFSNKICENTDLARIITEYPIELAYCLSLINANDRYSITPPWVLKNYPEVERIMFRLRNKPCVSGCEYCNQALD